MIFPLQESCGVFRAFLEIRKTAELKSYITFLRTPWAISGRKMIRVNFVTLCQIFTMSRSPYRESLLKPENVLHPTWVGLRSCYCIAFEHSYDYMVISSNRCPPSPTLKLCFIPLSRVTIQLLGTFPERSLRLSGRSVLHQ